MDLETIENNLDNDNKKNINNETNIDTVASTSLGSAVCETILPSVPLQSLETIEKSIQKKYRSALWTPFVKALKEFEMVKDGDRIAVAISGNINISSRLFIEISTVINNFASRFFKKFKRFLFIPIPS